MLKAAVIGLGDIAQVHVPILQALEGVQLVAVCDENPTKASLVPNARFYESARELLEKEKPDAVHICLPHYLHYPMAQLAAEYGVNVFCEKPLAMNAEEGSSFLNLEQSNPQLRFGLCLQNRYNRSVQKMLEILKSGTDGALQGLRGTVPWQRTKAYYDAAPWRGQQAKAGGGVMINQSIHTLDLLQLFGGEIDWLRGTTAQLADFSTEVEDTASANIHFKNGAQGLFFATNANCKNGNVEVEITLERAVYFIRDNALYRQTEAGIELICEDEKLAGTKFYYGASHGVAIAAYYKSLGNHTQDYIPVREGFMAMRMIDAIHASQKTGNTIHF